jgi:hypothetical protein
MQFGLFYQLPCAPEQHEVTRYHDIRHIFRTPALFSATNANSPLRPPCPMAAKALEDGGFRAVPTLANVDPPAHTRVRKLANIAFTPKRVAEMEGFVRDLVIRFCTERLGEAQVLQGVLQGLDGLLCLVVITCEALLRCEAATLSDFRVFFDVSCGGRHGVLLASVGVFSGGRLPKRT